MDQPVFARHETFHPRYSWIKKGFDEADKDPQIFISDDAHVRLGVGKNMVRAIRYWTHALGVLEYDEDASGRSKPSIPTAFGESLLGQNGYDPYLEDLGSLWLLHWRLLCGEEATGWRYAFFEHSRREVSSDELVKGFQSFIAEEFPGHSVADSSLKKDAHCILRMYGQRPQRAVSEESIQCPWAELRLLAPTDRVRTYSFQMGAKPGLSDELIASVCLEYAGGRSDARTVAVPTLLHGEGSPGLAFKLTEATLYRSLENMVAQHPELELHDTAGVIQLSFTGDSGTLATRLNSAHFALASDMEAVA